MTKITIIKSLFNWFADCEVLNFDNDLNVDYLDEDPENYCLEVVPCNPIVKSYVDGSAKCQYLFVFASREHYSSDEVLNMANLEFFERLEEWISEQNINGRLPNIYNSSDIKLMSLNAYGHDIYDSGGIKLMSLNSKGQEFFYKGNKVGYIGTGYYKDDANKRDLSFNLENDSAFMDWCYRVKSTDTAYTLIFTYAAKNVGGLDANQLHTGCDMNLQGHYLRNAVLKDFGFEGGSISGTWSGNIVTSFHNDGTAATWRSFSLTFKNGILQSATW